MSYFIRKYTRTGNGFKERLVIKGFKDKSALYDFLAKQDNNNWQEIEYFPRLQNSDKPKLITKAGTYAYAGGNWHNVAKLDPSILAHI